MMNVLIDISNRIVRNSWESVGTCSLKWRQRSKPTKFPPHFVISITGQSIQHHSRTIMSHSKELHHFYKGCSEILHAQTKSHLHITAKAYILPFIAALKLYGPLYLVTHIISRKNLLHLIQKTLPAIVRSSSFLAFYGGTFTAMQCLLLSLTHRAYRMTFFGTYFISAFISMFIEHAARRKELAVYVSNVGIDAIFRMLVSRGLAKPINNSVGIIFAVSWAILSYYQRHNPQHLNGAIKSIVSFLNGTEGKPNLLEKKLSQNRLVVTPQENICPHTKHGSKCEIHWMSNFAQSFLVGYGLKGLLALLGNLTRVRSLKSVPDALLKSFGRQQLQFGLFLGCLSSLSKVVTCLLRLLRQKDDAINTVVAGFIGGLSAYFSSSLEISMYIFSKALQTVFSHLTAIGVIRPIPYATELVYSFFTALLFYAGLWEPKNVRPSYMGFLHKITGGVIWKEFLQSSKGLREEFESDRWYAKSWWK